jgi:hypothetical protein
MFVNRVNEKCQVVLFAFVLVLSPAGFRYNPAQANLPLSRAINEKPTLGTEPPSSVTVTQEKKAVCPLRRTATKVIKSMQRIEESTIRAGGMGDNWHMTWARDDKQYAGLCDGKGWSNIPGYTGKFYNSRVFTINTDPPHILFENLPGYPDLVNEWDTPRALRYYGFGIIAIDDCIYQFLSTANHQFQQPEPRFV